MKFRDILIIFFILCVFNIANGDSEITIKAEVDKTCITTDETITYKLIITHPGKKIPQPKFPAFEGFVVLSQAQTSEISISKGMQKTFVIYVFIVIPTKIGRFKIEPTQIQIESKSYSSEAFEIEVRQGKGFKPELKQREQQQQPQITL